MNGILAQRERLCSVNVEEDISEKESENCVQFVVGEDASVFVDRFEGDTEEVTNKIGMGGVADAGRGLVSVVAWFGRKEKKGVDALSHNVKLVALAKFAALLLDKRCSECFVEFTDFI